MEVILKQDMPSLGNANEVVKVKDGYGRNYLIPRGFAIMATSSAKKINAENLKQRAHKEEKVKNEALENAKKLEKVSLKIGAKTSSTGKIFGSVNTIQIAEALKEKGYDIDRKNITIAEDQIKEVGTHKVTVKLHREVKVEVSIEIVAE